jgi:hypothetical protein
MWNYAKQLEKDVNPAPIILQQLTGNIPTQENMPKTAFEVCEKINDINNLNTLSENEKSEIMEYMIDVQFRATESKTNLFLKAHFLKTLNKVGYLIAVISLIFGGFSWWVIGFAYATWLAFGATTVASKNRYKEHVKSWELPVHILLHIIALLALIGYSIFNLING